MDFFSGCRLELTAPRSAVRQNKKIKRGRVVVQTTKEFTPAKVLITAVVFLVPSIAQYELRRHVKDVCRACIKDVVNNPNMQQHVAKQTWGLLLARLSYSQAECARSEEWFGRFKNARVISVKFSLALFRLFAALSSTTMNVKKRQRKFEKACKWAEYPRKLREWLLQTWGPGFQACFVDFDADENLSEWTLGLAKSRRVAAAAAAPPAKRPRRASEVLEPLPAGETPAVPKLRAPVAKQMRPRRASETPAVPVKRAPVEPEALPVSRTLAKQLPKRCQTSASAEAAAAAADARHRPPPKRHLPPPKTPPQPSWSPRSEGPEARPEEASLPKPWPDFGPKAGAAVAAVAVASLPPPLLLPPPPLPLPPLLAVLTPREVCEARPLPLPLPLPIPPPLPLPLPI